MTSQHNALSPHNERVGTGRDIERISQTNQRARRAGLPVRTVQNLESFRTITDDIVEGIIWERAVPAFVSEALKAIAAEISVDSRVNTSLHEADRHVRNFLISLGVNKSPVLEWMISDVVALASQFTKTLRIDHIRLRMELVCDDACRKFHRDAIKARLICTYSGPGTEYGIASTGPEPEKINNVPTGSPFLFKGKAWPNSTQASLLHRSPPIEHLGTTRLVIVIDEAPANQR